MSTNKKYVYTFDDEEDYELTDYMYRPLKHNSRKSLTPLFVYFIILNNSSRSKHLTQNEIINILKKFPFEIDIERKALGRIIHGLADSGLGIMFGKGIGCWYDSEGVWDDRLICKHNLFSNNNFKEIKPAA